MSKAITPKQLYFLANRYFNKYNLDLGTQNLNLPKKPIDPYILGKFLETSCNLIYPNVVKSNPFAIQRKAITLKPTILAIQKAVQALELNSRTIIYSVLKKHTKKFNTGVHTWVSPDISALNLNFGVDSLQISLRGGAGSKYYVWVPLGRADFIEEVEVNFLIQTTGNQIAGVTPLSFVGVSTIENYNKYPGSRYLLGVPSNLNKFEQVKINFKNLNSFESKYYETLMGDGLAQVPFKRPPLFLDSAGVSRENAWNTLSDKDAPLVTLYPVDPFSTPTGEGLTILNQPYPKEPESYASYLGLFFGLVTYGYSRSLTIKNLQIKTRAKDLANLFLGTTAPEYEKV